MPPPLRESIGPDMNPRSMGPERNPRSIGPERGPEDPPRGTGWRGTDENESVQSKAAAGAEVKSAMRSMDAGLFADDRGVVEVLALTEAPEMDRNVVAPFPSSCCPSWWWWWTFDDDRREGSGRT